MAAAFFVVPLYFSGYVSRQMVVAASPDGSIEAVCRGWYPHGTECELWLRKQGQLFGRKIGPVGTESMGRCAAVTWSPDGSRIAAVTTAGWVMVWDTKAGGVTGTQKIDALVYRDAAERPCVTPHMVRAIAFEPGHSWRVGTRARLWSRTHRSEDIAACAGAERADVIALELEPPRGGMLR